MFKFSPTGISLRAQSPQSWIKQDNRYASPSRVPRSTMIPYGDATAPSPSPPSCFVGSLSFGWEYLPAAQHNLGGHSHEYHPRVLQQSLQSHTFVTGIHGRCCESGWAPSVIPIARLPFPPWLPLRKVQWNRDQVCPAFWVGWCLSMATPSEAPYP